MAELMFNHSSPETPLSQSQARKLIESGIDLSHQDLYQINLSGIQLKNNLLTRTSLIKSNWTQAYLTTVDLSGADLRGATLAQAVLIDAKLCGACLYRTDLSGADLSKADLTDVQLQGARYDSQTRFPPDFAYKSSGAIGPGANLNGAALNTANLRMPTCRGQVY